jgi:hypothetical protein
MMIDPPPAKSETPAASGPAASAVPASAPSTLKFFVQVGQIRRNDLNELAADEGSVVHHVLTLAIGYDHRIYTGWRLDSDTGVLRLTLNGIEVNVPLAKLSYEELAAARFLAAAVDAHTPCRTPAWRAHVIEQLGTMVPLFDLDGDQIDPARAAKHFRNLIVPN